MPGAIGRRWSNWWNAGGRADRGVGGASRQWRDRALVGSASRSPASGSPPCRVTIPCGRRPSPLARSRRALRLGIASSLRPAGVPSENQGLSLMSSQSGRRGRRTVKDERFPQFSRPRHSAALRLRRRENRLPRSRASTGVHACGAASRLTSLTALTTACRGGTAIEQWRLKWRTFKSLSSAPR